MDVLQPTHLIFILVVALLVLGPKRLPEVGRSLGRGLRDFRGALSGLTDPDQETSPSDASPQVTPVTPATTTLPAEDTEAAPPFSAVPDSPPVGQPWSVQETASGDEQTGSALLPHVEPDEPQPISPAPSSAHKD